MTISSAIRKAGPFPGNGATVAFPFSFKVFAAADLVATQAVAATGAETTLLLTTHYTVALNADQNVNPGGTLTMLTAPPAGYTLTLTSSLAYLQPTDLTNQGGFYPSVINTALDRLTIFVQQLAEALGRSLKTAISTPAGFSTTLPAPVPYALIGWNGAGTGFQNTDPTYSTALATDLAASGGAAKVGFLQSGAGAVLRTIQSKDRDVLSVRDFGAVGDGVTNDAAAIQLAFTAAAGRTVYFPAGTYLCGAQITTSLVSVSVKGDGVGSTRVVFTAASGGFAFLLTGQGIGVPPDQLHFRDMTIESRAAVTSPALGATWSNYQANAQGSVWIKNVNITRRSNGTGSFGAAIRLEKCFVGFIEDVIAVGDDARVSAIGFELVDCVGLRISNVDINRYQTGIRLIVASATQSEGILIRDSFIYDVFQAINVASQAIHINIIGTHLNINGASASSAVSFINVSQSMIQNCLIYAGGNPGDALNQDGVVMLGGAGNIVSNNVFVATIAGNTRDGIRTDSGAAYSTFSGNQFSFHTTGIRVNANSTGNRLLHNEFYLVGTPTIDAGFTTYLQSSTASGIPYPTTTAFSRFCSSAQAVAAATSTPLNFQTVGFDDVTETTTSTFVAKRAGTYVFNAAVTGGQGTATRRIIDLYRNGAAVIRLSDSFADNGTTTITGNSGPIKLASGDVISVNYYSGLADTTAIGALYTYFSGHRIR